MLHSEIIETFPNRKAEHSNSAGVLLSRVAVYGDNTALNNIRNDIIKRLNKYTEMVYGKPELIKATKWEKSYLIYTVTSNSLQSAFDPETKEFYMTDSEFEKTYII